MRKCVIIALAALAASTVVGDVKGTIVTENGDAKKGLIRWSGRSKAYVVTVGKVEVEIPATEVAELDVDKPAAFDAAVEQVEKGQGAAAIPSLAKIVKEYAHLQWDKTAGRYLAQAYVAASKPEEALKTCQAIISGDPEAAYKGDLAPAYWNALLSLDKKAPLEKALEKAAKSGDRFSSASALIMRGDIILKDGKDSVDAAKKALTDGYLRVVLLYRDADVAARVRPEALYKAAKCFEKLGQSGRVDAMRTELKTYASSPWAAKQ